MKYKLALVAVAQIFYLLIPNAAHAEFIAAPIPIPHSLAKSNLVVEAELLTDLPEKPINRSRNILNQELSEIPSCTYTFRVINCIKGVVTAPLLHITLPLISSENYNFTSPRLSMGTKVILLLNENQGTLSPVDNNRPLIPIAKDIKIIPGITDPYRQVVHLMLASFSDPNLRKIDSYLLRDFIEPQIPIILANYINDPDPITRDSVLYCLATNQQVAVIPKIARLESEMHLYGEPAESTEALANFTTVEAVPYLNPLILSPTFHVRTAAIYSLYKIADKTSIPSLVLALRDPDSSQNIPAAATIALYRLIPALGPYPLQSMDDYIKLRQEQTKPIYQWWNEELEGQHLSQEEQTKLAAQTALPHTAAQLQVILWSPSTELRRRVMEALLPIADQTSGPYLVLALQDPDPIVAYDAYKALHKLIGTLGDGVDSKTFSLHRDEESRPLYKWWSNTLGDKPDPYGIEFVEHS